MSEEKLLENNDFNKKLTSNYKNKVPAMRTEKSRVEESIKNYNNSNLNVKDRPNSEVSKINNRGLKNLYCTYYNSEPNQPKLLIGIIRNIINGIWMKVHRSRIWGILVTIIINIIKMNFID